MNLIRFRHRFFLISLAVIVPGVISLVRYGLRPAIDFTGGSLIEMRFAQVAPPPEVIEQNFEQLFEVTSVQAVNDRQVIVRAREISNEVKDLAVSGLESQASEIEVLRFETVGPTLSSELLSKTLTAVGLVASLITLYVWRQFRELRYGVSAVLAMFHDSLVLLGVFSLLGHFYGVEVDVLFVTALLTTLSFSVHDTIVVFDRIRELRRKFPRQPLQSTVGAAVLETLGRSINNSITIIIMLLSLVVLGGETIRWFAVALLVGAVTGTYSSTFVAAPLLLLWEDVQARWRTQRRS